MHYLITGGAGFIGSHLADALLERGHRVSIIDDLSTGSIRNITHLRKHAHFRYVVDTMLKASLLAELVDEADAIFHLAAAVGVKLIVESPVRTIETNIQCTELLLQVAAKKKKKVLVTSTSEVYGKSTAVPFREDGDLVLGATTRGRWSYACSKAIDEFLAIAYWREKRLPTVVVRLFNTVGPRQTGQYGMVIPRFVSQALEGEPITIYGDGTQTRCFTHVSDTVRALIALMEAEGTVGEVFNIGSEQEITILELARRIREMAGSSSEFVFLPYAVAYQSNFEDMARRVPCLDKIRRTIGWAPTITIDGILESVIAHHRSEVLSLA
ncbi:MAG: GDP-mannose 4,6-dehydratase [Gemmatimonadota bacterium]|jgi:UDP-glucose 4-epimerase|nr:GDP-mannose 4,6-dehydratase [Gemmatimonadota bacterium]MDQ3606642.1 GDP-mannose 4,6-dehydratase [Gemmatimonadota bacterium]